MHVRVELAPFVLHGSTQLSPEETPVDPWNSVVDSALGFRERADPFQRDGLDMDDVPGVHGFRQAVDDTPYSPC